MKSDKTGVPHERPSILIIDWYYRPLLKRVIEARNAEKSGKESVLAASKRLSVGHHHAMRDGLEEAGWATSFIVINSIHAHAEWLRSQSERIGMAKKVFVWTLLGASRLASSSAIHSLLWPFIANVVVETENPDVVYVHDSRVFRRKDLDSLRSLGMVVVLQQSWSAPSADRLLGYSGVVSCLRWITDYSANLGISSLHLPLGVDLRLFDDVSWPDRDIDVSFVGSVTPAHPITVPLLHSVAERVPGLRIFGPESGLISSDPILSPHYCGQAWGSDMLNILKRSKVTLNRHGEILGNEAANYRLYEATASGAALVTDQRDYLDELFVPGVEVETYDAPEAAGEIVQGLIQNETRRTSVARAGQARTRSEHSMQSRMARLAIFLRSLVAVT